MELTFEWDEEKNRLNTRKHRVSFEEAKTIFNDPFLLTDPDPEHSAEEPRYISVGYSQRRRLLLAVHTERGNNIRIISCRTATALERRAYEESE